MKTPIVVYENGDVSLFDSVESAEQALEPLDVANSEYRIFDGDGNELNGSTEQTLAKGLFGKLGGTTRRVKISEAVNPSNREAELCGLLADFLTKVDPTFEREKFPRLSDLIGRIRQLGSWSILSSPRSLPDGVHAKAARDRNRGSRISVSCTICHFLLDWVEPATRYTRTTLFARDTLLIGTYACADGSQVEEGEVEYIEIDPIGLRGGIDTYAYVRGNSSNQ
jgi:hypothetical protein